MNLHYIMGINNLLLTTIAHGRHPAEIASPFSFCPQNPVILVLGITGKFSIQATQFLHCNNLDLTGFHLVWYTIDQNL